MNATREELKSAIEKNKTTLALIDTRAPAQMMIPSKIENAVNIPDIPSAMAMSPEDFKANFGLNYPEEGSTICLHCNVGGGSMRALTNILENHEDLAQKFVWKNVAGGVRDWNAEKELEKEQQETKKKLQGHELEKNKLKYFCLLGVGVLAILIESYF